MGLQEAMGESTLQDAFESRPSFYQ